jgi:SAM-dependent methyltransferase
MRVLDLASGRGEPAIPAAVRVAPSGNVVGVDLSEAMLQMARERAARERVTNLDLRAGDCETLAGIAPASFDVTLARWCLMYFAQPVAALTAARRALIPGGRLVAAVWAEPERVSYYMLPRRVLAKHAPVPAVDLAEPGTFHYAQPEVFERDLAAAGFAVTHSEEVAVPVMEARTDEELIAWTRGFGMARLLDRLPAETQRAWEADLVREAEALSEDGVVRLGGVSRIVVARC